MTKAVLRIRRDTSAVLEEMGRRFASAWKSGRPASARVFSFESPAALFRVLSPKRWELIERLQALGPTNVPRSVVAKPSFPGELMRRSVAGCAQWTPPGTISHRQRRHGC